MCIRDRPGIDVDLQGQKEIRFGHTTMRIIETPGHMPGHIALYNPEQKLLLTGDTLFRESIGRTDLPGGDYSWIMRSILDKLMPLGDDVHFYPCLLYTSLRPREPDRPSDRAGPARRSACSRRSDGCLRIIFVRAQT